MITWTLFMVFANGGLSSSLSVATIPGFATKEACAADAAMLAERYKFGTGHWVILVDHLCVEVGGPK
jgi:hypothetical protein